MHGKSFYIFRLKDNYEAVIYITLNSILKTVGQYNYTQLAK